MLGIPHPDEIIQASVKILFRESLSNQETIPLPACPEF
jgi:hypothetical protein